MPLTAREELEYPMRIELVIDDAMPLCSLRVSTGQGVDVFTADKPQSTSPEDLQTCLGCVLEFIQARLTNAEWIELANILTMTRDVFPLAGTIPRQ